MISHFVKVTCLAYLFFTLIWETEDCLSSPYVDHGAYKREGSTEAGYSDAVESEEL